MWLLEELKVPYDVEVFQRAVPAGQRDSPMSWATSTMRVE